ncbi:MAG: DUF3536 domain-containing protein [Thermoanaerobaculia bacterium]|nr:DUF3536 domain-containing protein [Thermoanaerobaculia bacterium]
MTDDMKRYLCIHGHFYQPPRENPWLETIEYQHSAHPFHDWNERVTAESYRPNSASRILGDDETIENIVNNYERISFNFGPTLLAWLEESAPDTYQRILEADARSREHFGGHGSALAQAYNHVIMPLANHRDKVTQVVWGIRDFESRFGRRPEGMWLPETGVDVETLEVLADHGIAFTILEPGQAKRFRPIGEEEWHPAENGSLDPTRAYVTRLPSGKSINLFFYDGPISRAIAFEKLLDRGEYLAGRLEGAFREERDWPQLVHIATDGETYGHHHAHGDMALAYALEKIDEREDIELTIYAEYLEKHPPEWEVEIHEDTSWSCAHGIERWRSACGCHTGGGPGWHQNWRGPLRDALDHLREEADTVFESEASPLLGDPWDARDDYIDVVLDRSHESIESFLGKQASKDLSEEERVRVLQLMELQRHAMLMYTSCGWFFNDISGIETVQVIQYAARVVQLAKELSGRDLETPFVERLEKAESNISDHANGRVIYDKWVRPTIVDLKRVASHYAVLSLFDRFGETTDIYCYRVEKLDHHSISSGRSRVEAGHVRVTSIITGAHEEATYGILYLGDLSVSGGVRGHQGQESYSKLVSDLKDSFSRSDFPAVIRAIDNDLGDLSFSIKSLFRDEQRRILNLIWTTTLSESEAIFRQLYDQYVPLMRFHNEVGIPFPRSMRLATELSINVQLRNELAEETIDLSRVRNLVRDATAGMIDLDSETIAFPFETRIREVSREFRQSPRSLDLLAELEALLDVGDVLPIEIDLWRAQTAFYVILDDHPELVEAMRKSDDPVEQEWARRFLALGEKLDIRMTEPAEVP